MTKNRSANSIIILVTVSCIVMAWVDAIWTPNYALKSGIKLLLFLVIPISYAMINHNTSFSQLFSFKKQKILHPFLLGVTVYLLIIGAYFSFGSFFDLTNITASLQSTIGVSKNNFIFVALYISFINSLLEEFFFRGFAFLQLKKHTNRKAAYFFSASIFAIYHVAIMLDWFSIGLFIVLVVSLVFAGMLFNWLNEKNESIYTSWFVHMAANFAINTIGFILFGII
ncbi:CPBP family intramembrane glutamic endopeptidase [Paraliobacillus sp. JSM ZJ581]|uniref:CPBP family intramembrane glutamic endopeptidase n=1 Tax=Paraliobacillus sp. JSM ZJ581 TaxID=3342118 RepID=UPI0035A826B0